MATSFRRVELRLRVTDPTTQALEREAAGRGVSLAEHIEDLLKARFLGASWGMSAAAPVAQEPASSAAALAETWM